MDIQIHMSQERNSQAALAPGYLVVESVATI